MYSPYGATSITGEANTNPSQFTGRENDGTGLYFYRARYYQPVFGRFISQDPAGYTAGTNLYVYANDDPTNESDPSGQFAPLIAACVGGAIFSVVFDLIGNALGHRKTTLGDVLGSAATGCVAGLVGLGLGKVLGAIGSQAVQGIERTGINLVYQGVRGGETYFGITMNYAARTAAHWRNGITIDGLRGLYGLTRFQARALEQAFIDYNGLPNLINQINSIAPGTALSGEARQEAIRLLEGIGGYDPIVQFLKGL